MNPEFDPCLTLTDADIIIYLKGEDRQLFKKAYTCLYKKEYQRIIAYIKNNSGSQEDGEDMFMEALTTLLDRIQRKNFNLTGSLGAFLFMIAQNIWYAELRRRKKERDALDKLATDYEKSTPASSEIEQITETQLQLRRCLEKLNVACRDLLMTFYTDGMTYEEIAEEMEENILDPIAILKARKYRCMQSLKKCINHNRNS